MKAGEIMTREVVTVLPDALVRDAAALLAEHNITSMPVVDEDGDIVGIVSESDLLRDRLPHDPRSSMLRRPDQGPDPRQRVSEVMSDVAFCLPESCDTADLAQLMVTSDVRAVPIVDGSQVIGIVSRRDLLRTLLRDDAAVLSDVRERLDAYGTDPDRWRVTVVDGIVEIRGHYDDARQEETVAELVRSVPGVVRVHTRGLRH